MSRMLGIAVARKVAEGRDTGGTKDKEKRKGRGERTHTQRKSELVVHLIIFPNNAATAYEV